VPPTDRLVPRFAAEPPQETLPYGRWAERLVEEFSAACEAIDAEGEDLGEPGEIAWYPDRTYNGRTYVPATAYTSTNLELFGYVSFEPAAEGAEPEDLQAVADFTAETAAAHPEWQIDLNDEQIGRWRGEQGHSGPVELVWGEPAVRGGAIVTAELAGVTVDQCTLLRDRFTLVALDDYRADTLEVVLWDGRANEVARESLYEGEA
jgi:hypothetical protein